MQTVQAMLVLVLNFAGCKHCTCELPNFQMSDLKTRLGDKEYQRFISILLEVRNENYQKIMAGLNSDDHRLRTLPKAMEDPIDEQSLCHNINDVAGALAKLCKS